MSNREPEKGETLFDGISSVTCEYNCPGFASEICPNRVVFKFPTKKYGSLVLASEEELRAVLYLVPESKAAPFPPAVTSPSLQPRRLEARCDP